MSEQLRLKSRMEVPNGGWRFFQPETVWTAPFVLSDTFDVAVRKIIYHRKGNARFNLPTEYETVALELEAQTANSLVARGLGPQYVVGAEKKTTNHPQHRLHQVSEAVAALVAEVRKDANGAASLAEWIGDGSLPVSQEQADSRAATCLQCPLNKARRGRIKEMVVAAITAYTQIKTKLGLRAAGEADLKTCAACDCPLKLKVWVPLKYILSHTDAGIFPDNCWVPNELKQPPVKASVSVAEPERPMLTIQRWGAFGDVITATALASRIKAHGFKVRFATHKAMMPAVAGHPDIAEVVEHGSVRADINLDGAYEQHVDRRTRSILSLFEETARKQVRNPDAVFGTNGHFRPTLVVTDAEKKPFLSLFSKFQRPWIVVVPKSGKWKNRSVPDETWKEVAELVNGTCFWTGYERIESRMIDLGTRDFRKVMAAIACADLVVTVDTGPMHVAAALNKPILAIQQAMDLSLRLPKDGNWTAFAPKLDCLKCGEFECPIDKENPPCTQIDAKALAEAINLKTAALPVTSTSKVAVVDGIPVAVTPPLPVRIATAADYISVVLTVFKRHQHVETAIRSIRKAGFHGEIVITAGGITPSLESVLSAQESNGIKVVRNPKGGTNNDEWIAGCKASTKPLIILFHDDDIMLSGYAEQLFPLVSGEADYSICDADGHGSPTAGPCHILALRSGVANSRMIEDTLMRMERTPSPILGCFPRATIIGALETWKKTHSSDARFTAWPGFEVGNDLFLWLKAASGHKRCLVVRKRGVSCNHHTGSATAANIASGSGQFETMYDLVRSIHRPSGFFRYKAICYVHDWSKATGLLRNLNANGGTDPVVFLTDADGAPGDIKPVRIPRIGPFGFTRSIKDVAAFVAFVRGIGHAKSAGLEWFFWLEHDCRVKSPDWLRQLWQENLAWPHDHVCSGTPVVWNLPMNGVAQAAVWMPYFGDYTAKTGRFPTLEGWRDNPQWAYPNGALAFYRTDTMALWFEEALKLNGEALGKWCAHQGAFDLFIGKQIVARYGRSAPKMMGWLHSAYSGCGDHYYTEDDRRAMLAAGLAAVHQEKDNSR